MIMSENPYGLLTTMVQTEILRMLKNGLEVSETNSFSGSRGEEVHIKIELSPNSVASNTTDASAVVRNWCHSVGDAEHDVKFSIYIRKCVVGGKTINPKSPKRKVEIHSFVAKNGVNTLNFTEIAKIEKEMEGYICTAWDATLPNVQLSATGSKTTRSPADVNHDDFSLS